MRVWLATWMVCGLLLAACGEESSPLEEVFPLTLRAESRDGPVPDVRFWSDGHELGSSDAQGLLRVELRGARAQSVTLTSACPPQYRTQRAERRLVLQPLHPEGDLGDGALTLTTQCEPLERQAAIAVRTRGAGRGGIPVLVGGQVLGQTDANDSAHLLVRTKPHATLRVVLDTSGQPELVPRNPVQTLQLEEDDEVFVVDVAFEVEARPRPATALLRPRPSARLPERIPSAMR